MLLRVNAVNKLYGVETILENVSLQIGAREKVALVGRNGAGKTTLLRIITGEIQPDGGSLTLAPGATIGYLSQNADLPEHLTVRQAAEQAAGARLEIQRRLEELSVLIEEHSTPELLDELHDLHERASAMEAFHAEQNVVSTLARLGFEEIEFDRPVTALSGGERTRLQIARLLLNEPDLLILDEPTNHLDIAAVEWLEAWVQRYPGAVIIVSHDRLFLERTAERVIEVRQHGAFTYPGPFSHFLRLREEEEARLRDLAAKQQAEIDKLDEFVRRFINSQRTAQARGRRKLMERLIDQRVDVPQHERDMNLDFGKVKRSGEIVFEAKKLTAGYPDLTLIRDLDLVVRWGEKWGIVGENGAGKSTLVKTLIGELDPLSGSTRLGSNVNMGWFSQDAVQIDGDTTPLEFLVWECGLDVEPARTVLGRFLFEGDDVMKPVRALSGGERNKLQLAALVTLQPNLLVLDEPTNHLDFASREALVSVLRDYPGTLLLVSHDRWLLEKVTDHLLFLGKSGHREFPGGFADFGHLLRNAPSDPVATKKVGVATVAPTPTLSPREISKRIGIVERDLIQAEEHVFALEADVARIEADLAQPEGKDFAVLCEQHLERKAELEAALAAWTEKGEELDALRQMQG